MLDAAIWILWPPILLISLAGLGAPLLHRMARLPAERAAISALVGLLVATAAVTLWNIFLPVGRHSALVTMSVGLIAAEAARRRGTFSLTGIRDLAVAGVVSAAILRMSSPIIPLRFLTDTVVYHLPHMEWIARTPLPLGAANLQARLGLNPGFMTTAAAFRWEPFGQTHLFILEVAIRALFLLVAVDLLRARRSGDPRSGPFVIGLVLASLPLFAINKSGTDGNVGFLLLTITLLAVRVHRSEDRAARESGLVLLVGLIGLASTFKLSAATAVLIALPLVRRAPRARLGALITPAHRPLMAVTTIAALGWSLRGFATTGCFAFPLGATCIDVPWGVGGRTADLVSSHVTEFARRSELTGGTVSLLDLSWVSTWSSSYLTSVPALIVIASIPVAFIGRARERAPQSRRRTWLDWAASVAATIPALLIVLSVGDLLGGRRFLGVDASLVGVIEDYPRPGVLLVLPLVGLVSALLVASFVPRVAGDRQPGGRSDHETSRPIGRDLAPYLFVTFGYWFLAAPAVRFSWATHVILAALLLERWVRTVDMSRTSTPIRRMASPPVVFIAAVAVLVAVGLTQPAAPLRAPLPDASERIALPPDGWEVLVPSDVDGCALLFPCSPTRVENVEVTEVLGRPFIRRTADDEQRLLRELGILSER